MYSLAEYALANTKCAFYTYMVGHLDVWGELASHKRSLTHRPSSQGWASRCPVLSIHACMYVYTCMLCWGGGGGGGV